MRYRTCRRNTTGEPIDDYDRKSLEALRSRANAKLLIVFDETTRRQLPFCDISSIL